METKNKTLNWTHLLFSINLSDDPQQPQVKINKNENFLLNENK